VQIIVQIKLLPDPEQREVLLATMQSFNAACNWLSERAKELGIFGRFKLQAACYETIRLLFGLSAQATCLVCRKVADAHAISKNSRTFRTTGAITYDLRSGCACRQNG
jgi:predicted transposase